MQVFLREWQTGDAAALAEVLSDKAVQDHLRDGIPYPYTEEDGRAFIAAMLAAPPDETFARAIVADGRVVGSIGVFRQGNIHRRTAEMGYYVGRKYWRRGIGTEAVRQMADWIFAHTDLLRLYAEPFACNAASCRVLEKAGFRFEGLLRANAVKNGQVLDMKLYARLRTDSCCGDAKRWE